MEGFPVGDPWTPGNMQGPQISEAQRQKVLGLIKSGVDSGARLVTGGGIPENLPVGYYVQPTLLADVDPDSQVAQEEIFGPVLTVTPYDTDDEAVAIANNSIYGLSGEVSGARCRSRVRGGQADAHRQRHHQRQEPLRYHQPVRRHQAERPRLPQRRPRATRSIWTSRPSACRSRLPPTWIFSRSATSWRSPRCCTATPARSTARTGTLYRSVFTDDAHHRLLVGGCRSPAAATRSPTGWRRGSRRSR